MKTTPEQRAELKRIEFDFMRVPDEFKIGVTAGTLRALLADLEEALQIIRQEQEVSIGTDNLLKGRISFLEAELAAAKKNHAGCVGHLRQEESRALRAENELAATRRQLAGYKQALQAISSIPNRDNCGDWDEIEEARAIADAALSSKEKSNG